MTDAALDGYAEVVAQLWPRASLRQRPSPGSAQGQRSFLVLPDPQRTRMLLPAGQRGAAARSLRRFSGAVAAKERLQRAGLAAALHLGGSRALRHRLTVDEEAGSLLAELVRRQTFHGTGGADPTRLHCSITMGPARANRKPVLQVFDDRGASLGFVKVGITPEASHHVRREAGNLGSVGLGLLPQDLEVPQLLDDFEWSGFPVVVMTSLTTSVLQRRLGVSDVPRARMRAFALAFDEGRSTLVETAAWQRLRAREDELAETPHRAPLIDLIAAVEHRADGVQLQTGAWHGDWTPWNMSYRRGVLQLWDFERFETGVPIALDELHYVVNEAFYGRRPDAQHAMDSLRGLELELRPGHPDLVTALAYVVIIVERYLQGGAVPDPALSARIDALLGLGDLLRHPPGLG